MGMVKLSAMIPLMLKSRVLCFDVEIAALFVVDIHVVGESVLNSYMYRFACAR